MSIALLEAMALGIPLVASSIPGNRRIVGDFKHGRLAPPDDPEGARSRHQRAMGELRSRLPHEPRRPRPRRAGILDPDRRPQASGNCSSNWSAADSGTAGSRKGSTC